MLVSRAKLSRGIDSPNVSRVRISFSKSTFLDANKINSSMKIRHSSKSIFTYLSYLMKYPW